MGLFQSKSIKWQEYMNNNFKEEFKSVYKGSYIIELNENRQPKDYCIDAEIIKQYINCDECKAINCKSCPKRYKARSRVVPKQGGGKKNKKNNYTKNKKNKYTKQKSSYDMVKLKNELFKNNKQDKNKNNKNNIKFQNLLDNITMKIFGEHILQQYGSGNGSGNESGNGSGYRSRKRSHNNNNSQHNNSQPLPYEFISDFKFDENKYIFLIGLKSDKMNSQSDEMDKYEKYVLKMTLLDDEIDDDRYVHESKIYEYVQTINREMDMNNCKFLKYYETHIDKSSVEGKIPLKPNNVKINFENKMGLYFHRYCLQVSEYNCNYIVFSNYLKMYIDQPELIINVMKKVLKCKQKLFIKYKYIHWDFHSDNLLIDITKDKNHVPVFFDFDLSTIQMGQNIVGTDYGEYLFGEKQDEINDKEIIKKTLDRIDEDDEAKYNFLTPFLENIKIIKKKGKFDEKECLIIGFFHDDVRILFDKYYFYDNDSTFRSKYASIIQEVFVWKYGVELSNEILKFVDLVYNMKNNNFLIEYMLMYIYQQDEKYKKAREMEGSYAELANFEYS